MGYLFVSESPVVLNAPSASNYAAVIAPQAPFTVWDSYVGGNNVSSQVTAPNGQSAVTLISNGNGELPAFRGPNGSPPPSILFIDTGGDVRVPIRGIDIPVVDPNAVNAALTAVQTANTNAQNAATSAAAALAAVNQKAPNGSLRILRATNGGAGPDWTDGVTIYPASSGRPAYNGPIQFMSANPPTADGALTGGGGMVPGVDLWVRWTAQ